MTGAAAADPVGTHGTFGSRASSRETVADGGVSRR